MSILVVSISHKTAGLDQLSALALSPGEATKLVHGLLESTNIDEAVVLSTCNRTEVYAAVTRFHGGLEDICSNLSHACGVSAASLPGLCSVRYDEAAVAHLFTVTAGLDSMVVGENQILGQVKNALSHAQSAGAVGTSLNVLFQQGLRVGKRVQHETSVGTAGRSLMTAALDELISQGVRLDGRRALVLGAGSMASLAAHTLTGVGAHVTVVNRTEAKGRRVAELVGGAARPWSELGQALAEAEVLVACTGARDITLGADDIAGTPISAVIDLGLPADVDPGVAKFCALVNLDLLAANVSPSEGVLDAQALVDGEVRDFLGARRAAQVTPTVVALRKMASEVVAGELDRLDAKMPTLEAAERVAVHNTVRRVVDKILHQPTVRVRALVGEDEGEPDVDYAAALRDLFALDPQRVSAVMTSGDSAGFES